MTEDAQTPQDGAVEVQQEPQEVDAGIDSSVEVAQLRAQLEESRKREQFLKTGYVAAKRPAWAQEAQRTQPELYALIGKEGFAEIKAESRRGFIRETERLAEMHAPTIQKLRSYREQATESVEQIKVSATETARREVQEAWGKPAGDTVPSVEKEKPDTAKLLQTLIDQQ